MSKPIHLFVSSSPELAPERETIGQIIATMPMTIGWRIGHTPLPGSSRDNSALWVEECDIYALILGQDFSAPMGEELRKAINKEVAPLAFWSRCTPSPSAQNTINHVRLKWRIYAKLDRFQRLFTVDLVRALVKQADKLELATGDLAGLALTLERVKLEGAQEIETDQEETERGSSPTDAGRGGVILGREVLDR